jgi:hypothetical protein
MTIVIEEEAVLRVTVPRIAEEFGKASDKSQAQLINHLFDAMELRCGTGFDIQLCYMHKFLSKSAKETIQSLATMTELEKEK